MTDEGFEKLKIESARLEKEYSIKAICNFLESVDYCNIREKNIDVEKGVKALIEDNYIEIKQFL